MEKNKNRCFSKPNPEYKIYERDHEGPLAQFFSRSKDSTSKMLLTCSFP